jgi:hypothetical protein
LHVAVEGRQRQRAPLRQFDIGGVIDRQEASIREFERGGPGAGIRFRVDDNVEVAKIGQRRPAEFMADPSAADGRGQTVRDFETPQRWNERALFRNHAEDETDRICRFVVIDPGQRGGTVEHKAHGRPSSR